MSWDGAENSEIFRTSVVNYFKQNLTNKNGLFTTTTQKWQVPRSSISFSESLLHQFLDFLKFSDGWKTW